MGRFINFNKLQVFINLTFNYNVFSITISETRPAILRPFSSNK